MYDIRLLLFTGICIVQRGASSFLLSFLSAYGSMVCFFWFCFFSFPPASFLHKASAGIQREHGQCILWHHIHHLSRQRASHHLAILAILANKLASFMIPSHRRHHLNNGVLSSPTNLSTQGRERKRKVLPFLTSDPPTTVLHLSLRGVLYLASEVYFSIPPSHHDRIIPFISSRS